MKEKPSPDYIGKFFPPIFALNTFDVWVYEGYTGLDFTSSNQARQQFFSLGRPLWAAFFEAGENLNSVLSLEKAKISQAPCFTLLSYCVSFLITDQSMGEAYVAEHIRYTISINKDRTFAQTIQPSEPVLAHAALQLLLHRPRLLDSLNVFNAACAWATIDIGDVGELVTAMTIIYSIGLARVTTGDYLPRLMKLRLSLVYFLGSALDNKLLIKSNEKTDSRTSGSMDI